MRCLPTNFKISSLAFRVVRFALFLSERPNCVFCLFPEESEFLHLVLLKLTHFLILRLFETSLSVIVSFHFSCRFQALTTPGAPAYPSITLNTKISYPCSSNWRRQRNSGASASILLLPQHSGFRGSDTAVCSCTVRET